MTHLSEAQEVTCGRFNVSGWSFGVVKTCYVKTSTVIDAKDFKISTPRDETVEALWLGENKNILYLPLGASERFPNLLGYSANFCSIKVVKKEHFQSLNKIKKIYLSANLIETIYFDTFKDLNSLEEIHLGKFKTDLFNELSTESN